MKRKVIDVQEYGIKPGNSRETVRHLRRLLDDLRGEKGLELVFPEGEYHFYTDYAAEILLYIPNHDEDTLKSTAFDLTGFEDLTINGHGSIFQFHTEIIPFLIRDSRDISLKGIRIDYQRPGYSQGIIRQCSPRHMLIQVDKEQFPYIIRGSRIWFTGEGYCHELERWMELDGQTIKPVYGLTDRTFNLSDGGESALWSEPEPGILKVELEPGENDFEKESKAGDYLILRHHPRNCPAVYIENSVNTVIEDLDIYHAAAMGVIAQRADGVHLARVRIMRHPVKNHVFTTEADALHFVSCRGQIHVEDCLCENQLDDPLNIHGIYGRIKTVAADGSFIVELVHHQQKGAQILKQGERFRVLHAETLLSFAGALARSVQVLNKNFIQITPDEKIAGLSPGQIIENCEWIPDVLVEGCIFRNNRARGILATTAGRVIIRNNVFQVPGAAVLIEGDGNDWFESGRVTHVTIEDNLFDCCAYVPNWGEAPIQISPAAPRYVPEKAYHGTVEIKGNRFRCFDQRLLWARNVEKILWNENTVDRCSDFPPLDGEPYTLEHVLAFETDERGGE